MKTSFMAVDLWDMVENDFEEPENEEVLTAAKKKELKEARQREASALSMLHRAVADSVFPRIMMASKANEAWMILKKEYQGDLKVLANEVNIGYGDLSNEQVLKLNGTWIRNIHHLAHLVDSCKDKYLVFEFEDNFLVVLEREAALAALGCIHKDYGIPPERSSDLSEPYVDSIRHVETINQHEAVDSCHFKFRIWL